VTNFTNQPPSVEQAQGWYPESDPVHGFDHVLRVMSIALRLGRTLDADLNVLQAAALLHDAAGAVPQGEAGTDGGRATHEQASAEFARSVLEGAGWPDEGIEAVAHCIRSHRYRSAEVPETLEARILYDADKLDVLGAFGIARTIGYAVQVGQPIYAQASAQFRATGQGIEGEPHSAYHEYLFKLRHVADRLYTQEAQWMAEDRVALLHRFFEGLDREAGGEI
jgi:uncharacterized protein